MGHYVAVNLSFSANNSEESLKALSEVAKATLTEVPDDYEGKHVHWMCEAIIDDPNRYVHGGNKGDMFVWSGVWDYYSYENEAKALKTFLLNIWKLDLEQAKDTIMFDFDKALLLINPEQTEMTYMYEFSLKEDGDSFLPEVVVRTHETELNWNQY